MTIRKKIVFTFLPILFLFGCSSSNEQDKKYTYQENDIYNLDYSSYKNLDIFDTFLNDLKKEKEADARIIRHTVEGDPLIWDLSYEEGLFKSTFDTSYDKFGTPTKYHYTCSDFVAKKENKETNYFLINCDITNEDVFVFSIKK